MAHPQSLGSDFYALDDITRDWRMARDERTAFAQAIYRRLATARGALCLPPDRVSQTYGRNYGLGVHRYVLEGGITPEQIALETEAEVLKDERVRTVRVTITDTLYRVQFSSHLEPDYPHTLTIDRLTGNIAMGE